MKNLEKFKTENLEINEDLRTQGGATKNDNTKGVRFSAATEVTATSTQGHDIAYVMSNDDNSVGDTFTVRTGV
jgi:hypothetical protein